MGKVYVSDLAKLAVDVYKEDYTQRGIDGWSRLHNESFDDPDSGLQMDFYKNDATRQRVIAIAGKIKNRGQVMNFTFRLSNIIFDF